MPSKTRMAARAILSVLTLVGLAISPLSGANASEGHRRTVGSGRKMSIPKPDCKAHVGYDRDTDLSGFLLPTGTGSQVCVPFSMTAQKPPADYNGDDFYVDAFTDAKLRARWKSCKEYPVCRKRLEAHIDRRLPPNREYGITDPHARFLLGKIEEKPHVDLKTVRRPAFFARAPYREPIAERDSNAYTVEFTVGRGPYERRKLELAGDIKLRGWYLRGKGVPDGKDGRKRALLLMSGGGGARLVAIEDPSNRLFHIDPKTGESVLNHFPNTETGAAGQRDWRRFMFEFNRAGFDVLAYDRRGVGVSGGYVDTNTLQQGRDILNVVQSLASGKGVRALTPDGITLDGKRAVATILGDVPGARLPVILTGNSRGTMSTGWAMARNFDARCSYDSTPIKCAPPVGLKNIEGAMMLADFSAGPGYGIVNTSQSDRDRALYIGGNEVEHGLVFFPSSAILASTTKWPALFIGRGLWDYAESLEGSIDVYDRISGPKELAVVRGPHPFETWPESERRRISDRMIAFATAVVLGKRSVPGGRHWKTIRDLVATASDAWEPSSDPARQ